LFGLHLKILETARESKHARILKQVDHCGNSTLVRRATNIGKHMLAEFNEYAPKFYNSEEVPILESICYSVKKRAFDINYGDEDKAKKKQKNKSIARALDEGNILRDPYRRLCAIEPYLSREGAITKERKKINKEMAQHIPISIIDINTNNNQVNQSEEEDIDNESIVQEVVDAVGKGGYRNIKNILLYLIPDFVKKGILNPRQPIVNLRISGDGRNVGRKVKHVIVTVAILDNKNTLHQPDHHHTTVLYPGYEDYNSLLSVMTPFCHDL